jgi:hypothetical protein
MELSPCDADNRSAGQDFSLPLGILMYISELTRPTIGPYHEADKTVSTTFFNICFKIMLPTMLRSYN